MPHFDGSRSGGRGQETATKRLLPIVRFSAEPGIDPPGEAPMNLRITARIPVTTEPASKTAPAPTARRLRFTRATYFKVLTLAFPVFNTLRLVAYAPTMLTIWESGRSDQHSLLTWLNWMAANATMAAWLYEHNGRRFDRTVLINISNTVMCGLMVALIAWFRF
jgi:hypothetical protein